MILYTNPENRNTRYQSKTMDQIILDFQHNIWTILSICASLTNNSPNHDTKYNDHI